MPSVSETGYCSLCQGSPSLLIIDTIQMLTFKVAEEDLMSKHDIQLKFR